MIDNNPFYTFSTSAMSIFSPVKSVIIDMIMVQLLAIIVTLGLILITGADNLSSDTMAYLVAGLFGAFFMLGGIYSRISSI
jgi:Na+/H+-translocating membrane pyrophosphatase